MNKRGWWALIVALAFSCAPPTQAQTIDTLKLDFDQAWSLALKRNESLQIARNNETRAIQEVKGAYSAAMPTVEMTGAFNHYFQVPSTIFYLPAAMSPTGQKLRIKTQFGSENNVQTGVSLTQPLWLAGKVGLGLDAAKTYRELSGYQVQVSKEDLRIQLTQAYYGTLLAGEALTVAKDALAQTQKHAARVKSMYEEGVASEYDMIRANVAVSNAKPGVSQAQAGYDLARKGLKSLLGVDVSRPLVLKGELPDVVAAPELDYDQSTELALNKRPELKQLNLQEHLYKIQYKVHQRSWLWPNFMANLSWDATAQSSDLNVGKYEFLGGYGGTLILQIPLFDGFKSHWKAQQAKIDMRNTRLQHTMATRGIEIQVYEALRNFQKSSEEMQAAHESLQQAQKGYDIAETRYQQGVGTQLEVLDSQLQLNVSKMNYLQSRFNLLMAKANYDRASGIGFDEVSSVED